MWRLRLGRRRQMIADGFAGDHLGPLDGYLSENSADGGAEQGEVALRFWMRALDNDVVRDLPGHQIDRGDEADHPGVAQDGAAPAAGRDLLG